MQATHCLVSSVSQGLNPYQWLTHLAGAFGSGAAFALEDGWILARAIEHTRDTHKGLAKALQIFDAIRSPYYLRMCVKNKHISLTIGLMFDRYQFLDDSKLKTQQALKDSEDKSFEASLKIKVSGFGGEKFLPWIYHNNIEKVWEEYLANESQTNGVH